MSEQTDYTDMPSKIGERIKDFLLPSNELAKREKTVKVIVEQTQKSKEERQIHS